MTPVAIVITAERSGFILTAAKAWTRTRCDSKSRVVRTSKTRR